MYPVSSAFQQAVESTSRDWDLYIKIQLSNQTLELGKDDVQDGGLQLVEGALPGSTLVCGGAVIAGLTLTIQNTGGRFDDTQFKGGVITELRVGLLVNGAYEYVPMGVFNIYDATRPTTSVTLTCKDNLYLLDQPFSSVSITYPATNLRILQSICAYCGVTLKTSSFLNSDYSVASAPEGVSTCRDVVSDIAEMAVAFVRATRDTGALELVWFDNPGYVTEASVNGNTDSVNGGDFFLYDNKTVSGGVFKEIAPAAEFGSDNRYDFEIGDGVIEITGVELDASSQQHITGSNFYAVDISQNGLIADDDIDTVLQSMADKLIGFTFLPFTANWQGNPALQQGDMVEHTDRNGVKYRTVVTNSTYIFRGNCMMSCAGCSQGTQGYISSSKKYAQLVRNVKQKQAQIDALHDAINSASEMIAGVWGGHVVNGDTLGNPKYAGNIFICDDVGSDPTHPDVTKATKVWRWNLGGFGFSSTGIDGPYATAITADGSIVANLMTASMIKTGILQSLNGSSVIDLDQGTFSFKNGYISFDSDNGLTITGKSNLFRIRINPTDGIIIEKNLGGDWSPVFNSNTDGSLDITGNFKVDNGTTELSMEVNGDGGSCLAFRDSGIIKALLSFLKEIDGSYEIELGADALTLNAPLHAGDLFITGNLSMKGNSGANGAFMTTDGKSVSVINGIIVSIT